MKNKMNIVEKTITELNDRIGFTPLIDIQSKELAHEFQIYTRHLKKSDAETLSVDVWNYLGQGGFLNHLEAHQRVIVPPPPIPSQVYACSNPITGELPLVAEDLNLNLGLIPQIDVYEEQEALRKLISESASLLEIEDKAELKPETWEFLSTNGMLSCVTLEEQKKERQVKQKQFIFSQNEEASNEIDSRSKLVEELIEKGKFTSEAIIEILCQEFSMLSMESHTGFLEILTQPKENIYPKLIIQDPDTGVLGFQDPDTSIEKEADDYV